MPRKTRRSSDAVRESDRPTRFHAPRELRTVSATRTADKRHVPSIRLSGEWLEGVGFLRGVEYLVLADVPNQILLVLTDP